MRYHVRFYNDVILVPCPVGPCPIISCHAVSSAQHTSPHHINLKSKVANQIGICGNIASLKVRLLTPCRLWEGAKSLKQQTNIYDNTEWLQLSEVREASENIVSTSRTPISSALQPFTLRLWPQVPNDFLGAWRSRKESCWPSWLGGCSKPQTPRLTQENKSDRNVPTKRWTMIRNNERVMKENESIRPFL